jgi:hypothetical protein
MDSSRQTLTDADIVQNSTHTVLTFTKALVESGEYELFSTSANTLLWAVGGSNDLLFHIRRGDVTLKFRQCKVISDTGVVTSGTDTEAGVVSVSDDNRSLWVAHGACAAAAWAILVPLAVGASLIRSLLEYMGLPKGLWFSIHRGLNMIAALLTICSFAIAVYVFNEQPGSTNFTELTHHTLGLVIFILTLLQAISGMCRPHLPHSNLPTVHIDADYESNLAFEEAPKAAPAGAKSTKRIVWEYGHRIVGVAILGMAWWEVQDGISLFLERFPDSYDLTPVFWAVVGSISACCGNPISPIKRLEWPNQRPTIRRKLQQQQVPPNKLPFLPWKGVCYCVWNEQTNEHTRPPAQPPTHAHTHIHTRACNKNLVCRTIYR